MTIGKKLSKELLIKWLKLFVNLFYLFKKLTLAIFFIIDISNLKI